VYPIDFSDACCAAVFEALNRLPSSQHGCDIMRVREACLAGHAHCYRQTLLLSSFASAEMNALANRGCANHAGCARLRTRHQVGAVALRLLGGRAVHEQTAAEPWMCGRCSGGGGAAVKSQPIGHGRSYWYSEYTTHGPHLAATQRTIMSVLPGKKSRGWTPGDSLFLEKHYKKQQKNAFPLRRASCRA
jgi:Utp25, U3 small nucleolar RNA-associated SSU processome protein 25